MVATQALPVGNEAALAARSEGLDRAKGIAILFVCLRHGLTRPELDASVAWLHLGQAVPIFILVTGYLACRSWERHGLGVRSYYAWGRVRRMLTRIALPLAVVLALEAVLLMATGRSPGHVLREFVVMGGWGPGSYYPWVYLQLWFLLPFILWLTSIRTGCASAWAFLFVICFAAEAVVGLLHPPSAVYRLLCVRYFFALCLGILWARDEDPKGWVRWVLAALAAVYIGLERWRGPVLAPVLYPTWPGYHAPAYFYSLVVVGAGIALSGRLGGRLRGLLAAMGQASYEIFLTQMVYFFFMRRVVVRWFGSDSGLAGKGIMVPVALLVCVGVGMVGWRAAQAIRRRRRASPYGAA